VDRAETVPATKHVEADSTVTPALEVVTPVGVDLEVPIAPTVDAMTVETDPPEVAGMTADRAGAAVRTAATPVGPHVVAQSVTASSGADRASRPRPPVARNLVSPMVSPAASSTVRSISSCAP